MSYFSTIASFHALNSCWSRKTTRVMRRSAWPDARAPGGRSARAPRVDLRLADAAGEDVPAARQEVPIERLRGEHPVADNRDRRGVVTDVPFELAERDELVLHDLERAQARRVPEGVGVLELGQDGAVRLKEVAGPPAQCQRRWPRRRLIDRPRHLPDHRNRPVSRVCLCVDAGDIVATDG